MYKVSGRAENMIEEKRKGETSRDKGNGCRVGRRGRELKGKSREAP